jgi:hypothetical protein
MLYHDMKKQLMIWLWCAPGDPDSAAAPAAGFMKDYQKEFATELRACQPAV